MSELTQLRRVRESLIKKIGDRDREMAALRHAAEGGDESAEVSLVVKERQTARDRLDLERTERRIAVLEAEERQEAVRVRMVSLANETTKDWKEFARELASLNDLLQSKLPELLTLRDTIYGRRSALISEARVNLGLELHGYARQTATEAEVDALLTDLTERGADLTIIRALPGQPCLIDAGDLPPSPRPWGWLIEQTLNGLAQAQATQEHIARMETEQAARRAESPPHATTTGGDR